MKVTSKAELIEMLDDLLVHTDKLKASLDTFTEVLEAGNKNIWKGIDFSKIKPSPDYVDFMNALQRGDHLNTDILPLHL